MTDNTEQDGLPAANAPETAAPETQATERPRKKRFAWLRGRSFKFWLRTIFLLILGYLALIPFIRPVLVMAWSVMPLVVIPVLGIILGSFLLRRSWRKCGIATIILAVIATGLVGAANYTGWWVESEIASYIEPKGIAEMPKTVDNRVIARPTALHYAENTNRDNRLTIGRPHLLTDLKNDQMYWQVPLHYTVWYGKIFGSTGGVVRVNANDTGQDAKTMDNSFFLFGDESWMTRAMFSWFHPFSDPAEVVYWKNDDGTWSMLISHVSYSPTISGVMIPTISGVMEINQYGIPSNYSVEEAAKKFPGAALFPEELGRMYAQAYAKFKHGPVNYFVAQKDILMLSEDDTLPADETGGNRLPHYQEFEGLGLQLIAPMEPNGQTSSALKEVLFFDAITGEARTYELKADSGRVLNGPRQARTNVHKADNQADWPDFASLEAKLIAKGDHRFWLFTVNRKGDEQHAFVMLVLVDGYTLNAKKFDSKESLDQYLDTLK